MAYLHVVMAHCILSLCIALCHSKEELPYSAIASESKQSLSRKQTVPLDKGGDGSCQKLTKKDVFTQQRNREYLSH